PAPGAPGRAGAAACPWRQMATGAAARRPRIRWRAAGRGLPLAGPRTGLAAAATGPALGRWASLFLQRLGDELLERRVRLGPAQEVAVDHERRRAADAGLLRELHVGVDLGLVLARIERLLELGHVEAELLRDLLEVVALEPVRVALGVEQLLVEVPEALVALLREGFLRRLRSQRRVLVERQRV